MTTTAIFFSDVHIKDPQALKTQLVIRFLQEVASRYESIYILGDFFDAWPATTPYLVKLFQPVTSQLQRLVRAGNKVHYFEGNHDFHLGHYFEDELGIQVHTHFLSETLAGKKTYIAHGDLGNPKDYGYRLLRCCLRSRLTRWGIRTLPQDWVFRLGLRSSELSQSYQAKKGRDEQLVRRIYRAGAIQIFNEGYDMVMMGHTHLPDDYQTMVEGRPCRYLNTGDWVKNFTYLEFDGRDFYTRHHRVRTQ